MLQTFLQLNIDLHILKDIHWEKLYLNFLKVINSVLPVAA